MKYTHLCKFSVSDIMKGRDIVVTHKKLPNMTKLT